MSARLQQHFQQLREELAADTPLDADDRAALLELMQEIDLKLAKELASDPDATLVDGVNLAVERFESQHPTLTGTLRNILQSLANRLGHRCVHGLSPMFLKKCMSLASTLPPALASPAAARCHSAVTRHGHIAPPVTIHYIWREPS